MRRFTSFTSYGLLLMLVMAPKISFAHPDHHAHHNIRVEDDKKVVTFASANVEPVAIVLADAKEISDEAGKLKSHPKVSGQGKLKFSVLYTRDHLPQASIEALEGAHGGFAVDRQEGKGEIYFALPGAGIIQVSGDLKTTRLLDTPPEMRDANSHNATVWHHADGTSYLSFPANAEGKVFTTTLDGKLVHTLSTPKPDDDFDQPKVNDYFRGGGGFVPTDVEHLDGLLYISTGYSKLDYVLTARIVSTNPFVVKWHDLAFGGKGEIPGQFGIGHGITVPPGSKRLAVSDRPNSEVERFTHYGHYRDTVPLPKGALPCDIDYVAEYAIVGCLRGPDRDKGAPIYILEGDKVVSTIMPKEDLGLEKFQHLHDAVLRQIDGRLYIVAQTWNPGDFVILEQVAE